MPLPLPNDRAILHQVYQDASAVAAALDRLIEAYRHVKALRKAGAAGYAAAERRLLERSRSDDSFGPPEAMIRILPFLPIPSHRDSGDDSLAWFREELATLKSGDHVTELYVRMQRRLFALRDAALERLTEVDRADRTPTGPTTTGRTRSSRRTAPKVPLGSLDERAAVEVAKNPSLTYAQLAEMLECSPSTLRDHKRYPLVAAAKKRVKAERERFRGGDAWEDRQADDG
jgi:hypothetical protein